jgi:hypothetical protein
VKAVKRGIALCILATWIGAYVESVIPCGDFRRAPFTGAAVFGLAGILAWAVRQLEAPDGI